MSYGEWIKKKREKELSGSNSTTTSTEAQQPISSSTGGGQASSSYGEWIRNKRETSSVQAWAESAKNLLNETQNYFGTWRKYDDADDEYNAIRNRRSKLLAQADSWRQQYAGNKEAISYIDSVVSALADSSQMSTRNFDYYSQWATEGAYNDYKIGWLNPEAEINEETVAGRKAKYQSNLDRIAEIKGSLPGISDSILPTFAENWFLSDEEKKLKEEMDSLEAENNQYLRTQGVLDQYYVPVTDEFTKNAAYRNYKNASKDELWDYDLSVMEASEVLSNGGYFDDQGNARDRDGNIVMAAEAPVVEDKLGMYLSYSRDDVTTAYNELLAGGGNYTNTWANYMQEGDVNGWRHLKPNEIDIYYDLYKREGQEAAYKYLEDMTTELTRRETAETKEYVDNASGWEQIGLNIASVPMNVFGGVASFVDDMSHIVQGEDINPYSRAHALQNTATDVRSKTAEDINVLTGNASLPWVDFTFGDVYQSLMSAADSAVGVMVGGNAYGVLMGTGAASSEMKRLYEQGASVGQIAAAGILAGAAEMVFEKYSIDKLVSMGDSKTKMAIIINALKQGGIEASEEVLTEIANTISNAVVMGNQSDWVDLETFAKNVVNAGIGGFISGGAMGGIGATANYVNYGSEAKKYGQSIIDKGGLDTVQQLATEMSADKSAFNAAAIGKLSDNVSKNATAKNVGKLADLMGDTVSAQNKSDIAAALEEKGLSKKDAKRVAEYLDKATHGEYFTDKEAAEIESDERITDVYSALIGDSKSAVNTRSQNLSAAINGEEYRRLVEAAQLPQETAEDTGDHASTEVQNEAQTAQEGTQAAPIPANDLQSTDQESLQVAEESPVTEETETVTLDKASEKYGAQAQAMVSTYNEGQDVAKYDAAYQVAYDMGKSGVSLSYVMKSDATSYLTEQQRQLAYATGRDAANAKAEAKDAENKKGANGNTGRKKGVVRGDGVTVKDLDAAFNTTQSKAYKYLTDMAEATGVDIVLYRSQANANGEYEDAQGKYSRNEPGTLYIDLNAGLRNITDEGKLHRYFMLRTFAHEFTHFVENWNPIQYNEFRKVVFDTMTERGENVHDLIEEKQRQNPGMSYDKASREVVAEAMVDILPDSSFVQELAQNHKNIFQKLLDKLKEFVENLRAYYDTIGGTYDRGAIALKEQVGDTMKYLDSIVKMWDQIAVQAVENYQQTVATKEATQEQSVSVKYDAGEAALLAYKSSDSYMLNAKLRNGMELGNKEQSIVKGLDDALPNLPVYQGTVYRNLIFDDFGDQEARDAFVADHVVGEILSYSAYTSTSTKPDGYPVNGNYVVHMIINSVNGRNLEGYGNNFESEVLFPRNSYFETDRIEYAKDGTPTIYLTEVSYGQQGAQDTSDGNSGREQGQPTQTQTDKVRKMQKQKPENADMQPVSARNSENDLGRTGNLSEVQGEVTPKPVKDQYDEISDSLQNVNEFYKGGYEFSVREVPDAGYIATIRRNSNDYVSDARHTIFSSMFATRQEAVADLAGIARNNKLLEEKVTGNTKPNEEVNANVQNAYNTGAVQQSEPDGRGAAPVLDERETGDVSGDGINGDAVADASERGQQTGRDGDRSDSQRTSRGSGEGNRQSGDLRGSDGVSQEEQSARDYATQKGYGLKINSLAAKKGMTQVDIHDKQNLPTFNPVIINETSDWNKVKDAIDKREAADKAKAEKLHEEVVEQIEQKSTEQPKGRNFVIGDSLDLPSGEKSRYKANIEAIQLVKKLEAEGRYATEAEQTILSKYVGWGGLANAFDQRKADWAKEYAELKELLTDEEYTSARGSTLNAHYTDISVIKAMYDGLKQLGFTGGRMLEPSSGVGNFVGAMPADMASQVRSWTMVELDGITGLIAKHLYPNADVRIQGFEKANIPNNFMDVAISNVPFGNYAVVDKAYPKKVTSAIHNYFFAKTLDKVRPGGIVMFITSSYTMNAKESTVRRYIMQKADLLGAIRLPDTAFKGNAGTEVVTDILVLKKRAANTTYAGEDFLEAPYQYLNGYNGAYINSYFANHPEMVLGTASFNSGMYGGGNLTYKALEGKGTLADQIREAFKNIQGKMDYPAQLSREKTNFAVERAGKKTKENGLVVKDGKVYRNTGGELVEQKVANGAAERISGMLEIRDAAKELQTYLQQGLNETEIRKARTKLNKAYDAFVKKHGFINSQANKNAINSDPDRYSILALENWNPETKKATKSDIFTKNTIAANRTVTSAKDVAEGLIVSVNQTGGVDTALIAKLTGKTEAEVTSELLESRQAFKNRDGQLETAEVYLSGNVRAKLRDAEAMVPMDADYQKNVEALKAVVPEDVGYQDIFVNPGTPWIPDSVYSDFVAHMLGTVNHEWNRAVDVTRNKDTGNFTVELRSRYLKTNSYNTQKWGTARRSFLDLFDAMLNSKSVVVKDKLDDGSYIINKDATAAANEKIENIQKEFQEWLWKDEARRTELATLYNETFNSVVTPKYNGDNLTVNGANAMKPLRPHQRNAVQRVISSGGNTLLAHKVGAGKTYEMAAAAMKLKQLGLVKKPMFAVPKSLVAQWGNEFVDFFPTAKLLVAEAGDFTAANRKIFMNRIANGDYDAVIVSYEQFEKLPVSADFTRDLYQEQINSIISAIEEAKADKGGKSLSVKDLEKKRKSLQAKIDKLSDTAKDEDNIDFEQLGVDSIFVDEAHNFKNLFYTTSMTNVSGLGNKDGSKRAFDLYTKVRYLQKLNGGRGIVFATATPVMNSMSEMYIMQKYLQPDLLEQLGLSTFDAWAKQFGEVVNGVEIKPSGQGYRVKQSFSRFKNMSELQLLFRNFADVLTDIPGLKIPKMKGGRVNVVVCEPGQFQQDYMKELEKRADNIKSVDPSVDNMLKITSDGRKISYTQRMIDPTLPYEEGCKIYRCADNVLELYQESKDIKGTQLVFCDMATPKGKSNTATTETDDIETDMESTKLYDDLKARLVKGGIPAKQIAFIHEADTDAKKKKLFADVNDGTVRVLIGSTGKMGVGMNAQKRVVAIHHLDAPWRPGDVEQRNGRAFRQGNINDEVECFTYVTEGSFDARLWDILERKQNFINQVMNGENVGRETEDTGEVTLSAAEVKALASGSPLIMEQVQLDTDIKKLESLYRAHRAAVTNAKSRLEKDKGTIATMEKYIANGKADVAAIVDTYSDGKFSITVGKQKFTEKKDAGVALMAEATAKANEAGYTTIGKFAGFDLRVIKTHEGIKGLISGQQGYSFNTYPNNTTFMINHLVAVVEGMSEKVQQWEQQLSETRKDLAEQEKLITQPFAKQAELDQKRARYNEVMEILNPKEEQSLDGVDEDAVQEQSRHYLSEDENNDQRRIQTSGQESAGLHIGSEGQALYRGGDRTDGRGSTAVKEWEKLSKREKTKILKAVQSNISNPSRYEEIRIFRAAIAGKAASEMTLADIQAAEETIAQKIYSEITDRNNSRIYLENRWSILGNIRPIIEAIYGENVQFQQRTNTLTDREVLLKASEEVTTVGWTDAEKDALDLFQQRLSKLESLETERAEQGRLYREQQFGAKVDRAAAEKTLNRMKILDSQIEAANADVLSIESKQVLRQVLQKARKVVEADERLRGDEKLKRWRDRRNNADAIKKYRERLRKDVNDLTGWVLHPDNKDIVKHIPDALKNSVIPFLSSIDFTSKQQLRGGDATKADQEFIKRLKGLKSALKPQLNLGDMYEGYTDLPPNFMEKLQAFIDTTQDLVNSNSGEFVVNQMSSEELRELSQVVRTLKEYIKNFNKFHANAMFQNVHEAGDNTIGALETMGNAGPHTGGVSNFVFWQQMRPAYAFERFGNGGKAIYDGLRRGQAKLAFNTKVIVDFSEKTYTEAEVKAWEKQIKDINLGGTIIKMPVSTIMSFYELSKRPQALGHILGNGIRVATYKAGGKKISDVGHQLTPEDVQTIIGTLTDRQKEVADNLQKFMQEQGGKWGNYVSVKRFGEELFGEDHYFPINSDGRHLQANADEHPSAASLYALLNMGFTKSIQEGANNRLVLYSIFDVFANHMASMAQYNALALPVVDALKWFNYQQKSDPDEDGKRYLLASVRDQMDRVYGVPEETRPGSGRQGYAQNFVVNILKAFNGTEAQGVPTDAIGIEALHRYNVAQVAYNFRVVVQQPLAITRAALLIDYGSIIKGMKISPAAIKKNIQEMQSHSGIAAWKSLGFYDVNISRGLTDLIKHKDNWMDKVSDVGMWGAEQADLLTWAGIWSACKEEVIKKQRLTPKSEGFYDAVTQLFEEVIYKTQVVDSVLTKNEYLRSKGLLARLTGSFMSEPSTTASMLIDAYDKYHADMQRGMTRQQAWKKNARMIGRTAYVYGLSAVILAAVQAIADAFRDDDDYETFMEKWLEAFGGNIVDEVMPFNKLPLFSLFYEFAKEMIALGGFDIYGQMSNLPYVEIAEKIIKGTEILRDKITGEDTNYTWYAGIYKIFQGVSGIFGLPMAAATREIVTVWNNIVGAMAPSLKVKTYDAGGKNEIKYAYQDGYLTDEEAAAELLKQGIVDNENEAYWMIQGWEAGEGYSRYDAIFDAVRNGGDIKAAMAELTSHGYKEDDVLNQVKSKIGEWYKDGQITKQQAANMLTKYFDLDSEEITAIVNKWSSKVVTGTAFEDIKNEFLEGNITAERAIDMYARYGGYTKEKATETVNKWRAEKETGIVYEDIKDSFMDGKISQGDAKNMYITYGGYSEEDANEKVTVLAFVKQHPETDGISYAGVEAYKTYCESHSVPAVTFYDAWKYNSNASAEVDASGKSISGSKKVKVLAYINNLDLTSVQKDSLYYAFGWAESKIYEAPWH